MESDTEFKKKGGRERNEGRKGMKGEKGGGRGRKGGRRDRGGRKKRAREKFYITFIIILKSSTMLNGLKVHTHM